MQPIIHGKHFSICDSRGDMTSGVEGLYAHDVRYLSRWLLHVDGRRPQPLGAPIGPHHERQFRQRNIAGDRLPSDTLMITRDMLVSDGLYQRLTFTNLTSEPVEFEFGLEIATDFADIFQVKEREFAAQGLDTGGVGLAGEPVGAPAAQRCLVGPAGEGLCTHGVHRVVVHASQEFAQPAPGVLMFTVQLAARASWECDLRAAWDEAVAAIPIEFERERAHVAHQAEQFVARAPTLHAADARLEATYEVSLADLAALRIEVDNDDPNAAQTMLPAAGMPWFMTTFGRDTLITCLQTMTLGAERAERCRPVSRCVAVRR